MSVKGDERRTALLVALEEHLRESSLEAINVADLSRRAGVTRSAFYFYFESKAAAVAALMAGFYDDAFAAALRLSGPGHPADRISDTIRALADALDVHRHTYLAMLEARATNAEVRDLWEVDRASFVPVVAQMIDGERAADDPDDPDDVDSTSLAGLLLELNDRLLERLARTAPDVAERDRMLATASAIWLRSIHGTTRHLDRPEPAHAEEPR